MKSMEKGHLGLPQPKTEQFSSVSNIQTRSYQQFSSVVKDTEYGKQVLGKLESDPRVKELDGHMIARGSIS